MDFKTVFGACSVNVVAHQVFNFFFHVSFFVCSFVFVSYNVIVLTPSNVLQVVIFV